MLQDVITYLKKPSNIRHIMPELEIITDLYRFDSRRFDILACNYSESRFYGITNLRPDYGFKELQKIVKDAEWIKKYDGAVITLAPANTKALYNIFGDEVSSGLIIQKYYVSEVKDYLFMDDLKEYETLQRAKFQDTASKVLTSPQILDFVLKQFEKKSPAIKLAREAYKAYTKIKK
jgi:hypothetical protein